MSKHERAQRVRKVEDIVAAIEDIIIDKAGAHVLRSGMDGSFTIAGGQVARMIDDALAEAAEVVLDVAAVEAAARNLYVSEHGPWDGGSGVTSAHLTRARAALEAAAPHMLAEAKADAYDEGFEVAGDRFPAFNPYR